MIWNESGGEFPAARDAIRAGRRRQLQLAGCHHRSACTVLRARVAAIVIRVAHSLVVLQKVTTTMIGLPH